MGGKIYGRPKSQKDKKAIRNAFADLMAEKSIDSITVKEIAERADIHRVTFYSHYEDVYDLYAQIQKETLSELDAIIGSSPSHNYDDTFKKIIEYIAGNKNVCTLLFCGGAGDFQTRLYSLLLKKYEEISLYESNTAEMSASWHFLSVYNVYGTVALLSEWIRTDMKFPPEELEKMLRVIDDCMDPAFDRVAQS